MPFNYLDRKIQMYDFVLMAFIPLIYYYTFFLAMFEGNSLMNLSDCKNICMLGDAMFLQIGVVSYSVNFVLTMVRMKRFYPDFYEKLEKIDLALKNCARDQGKSSDDSQALKAQEKVEKRWLIKEILVCIVLIIAFCVAIYHDMSFLEQWVFFIDFKTVDFYLFFF